MSYILEKQPQFLIIDDVFSNVDAETIQFMLHAIEQLAHHTLIIQLLYRRQDVLPFIHRVLCVDKDCKIIQQVSRDEFLISVVSSKQYTEIKLPHLFYKETPAINPLVLLQNVSAQYGDKIVLRNICWTIQSGEFWQLKGPIGSGKSTLLSMIIGDNPMGYGQHIVLFGRKKGTGETIWDIKKQIGYFTPSMTQQFYRNDTVENMIISGFNDSVGLYLKPTGVQQKIAQAWLHVLGDSFKNKNFLSLSFGQQRMVLVVRALVKHPPLLILDEPTVGLDDDNASLFIDLIKTIAEQKKVAIIYVSHRAEERLKPTYTYELLPNSLGSVGKVVFDN